MLFLSAMYLVTLSLNSWRISSSVKGQLQLLQDQFLLYRVKCPMHLLCLKYLWLFKEIPFCFPGANLALPWLGNNVILFKIQNKKKHWLWLVPSYLMLGMCWGLKSLCWSLIHCKILKPLCDFTPRRVKILTPWIYCMWHWQKPLPKWRRTEF